MLGPQRDIYSMYKRASFKEHDLPSYDREENIGRIPSGVYKDNVGNPSWKHSLPHILVATLSSFLYGYHLGVVNETLESISLDLGFGGSTLAEGLVVSTCLAGAFVGSIICGWIADGVGRRRAFQLSALPMIIGTSMSATTNTLGRMLIGRLLVGIGMGLGPPVAALYVAEVSPASVRGMYGSFPQIATCLGLMGSLVIGIPSKDIFGWWRICFWVSVVPAALLAVLMELCVESPHWLVKRGRIAAAEETLEKLIGLPHVKSAIAELTKSDKGDGMDNVKFSGLFHRPHLRVVFIGSVLFALQQLSGINAVFYFSSTVFKSAGVPSDIANISVGIVNLIGSIIAMILMDRLGRKMLLIWSFWGMAVAMASQVLAACSFTTGSTKVYLSVGGILLLCFVRRSANTVAHLLARNAALSEGSRFWDVLSFSLGAGPVPSLLLSEIFPGWIRAKAMALCMAVHWMVNFFVGLLFLQLLEQLGPRILYTIFGTFSLIAVVFVGRNVVETKGKTLQEIEFSLLPSR